MSDLWRLLRTFGREPINLPGFIRAEDLDAPCTPEHLHSQLGRV
jgi:hypothetical protein